MKTILAATLVIRVLGLATVTNQVPNDCGTHVIVPRVDFHSHAGQQQAPQVEDHTAMLVVHKDYYDPASTWKMTRMPAFPSYMYAPLDGDAIRVVTNAVNPPPDLSALQLPSLKGCCPTTAVKGLRPSFQAPYTGAAAVLDVPGGTVKACSAQISKDEWRYDTEIFLKSAGSPKISGDTMKAKKEILLRNLPTTAGSSGVIYLANLPTCFLTNSCKPSLATDADGLSHVHAYYEMLEGLTSGCTATMKKCKLPAKPPAACKTPMIHNAAGLGGQQAFTFECSNTKWP